MKTIWSSVLSCWRELTGNHIVNSRSCQTVSGQFYWMIRSSICEIFDPPRLKGPFFKLQGSYKVHFKIKLTKINPWAEVKGFFFFKLIFYHDCVYTVWGGEEDIHVKIRTQLCGVYSLLLILGGF